MLVVRLFVRCQHGRTALHCGCKVGVVEVVTALIGSGADVNIANMVCLQH